MELLYNHFMSAVDHSEVLEQITSACRKAYAGRLVSLAVFGSVGRGTARPDSDIDLLLVVDGLSSRRMERVREFAAVEGKFNGLVLSPILKIPAEIQQGSPLLLDMVEDAVILYDRDEFLAKELDRLRQKLTLLGAKRIWQGNVWYWDLKPDYQQGEVFEV